MSITADTDLAGPLLLRRGFPSWQAVLSIVVFSVITTAVAVPRLLPLLLPLLVVGWLANSGTKPRQFLRLPQQFSTQVFALAVICVVLRGIAASQDVPAAIWLVASYAALTLTAVALAQGISHMTPAQRRSAGMAVIAAAVTAGCYFVIEITCHRPLITWVLTNIPLIAGRSEYTFILDGAGQEVVRWHLLNRGVAAFMLLLWPVLLLTRSQVYRGGISSWAFPVVALLAAISVTFSAHEASKLALLGSLAIFLFARASPRGALIVVATFWTLANLCVLPAVQAAHRDGWQLDARLTGSARARITIWNYTAHKLGSDWISGRGIDSVRQDDMRTKPTFVPGEVALARTGRHSHNVYLQVWYEFGAAGALLLTLAGLTVIGWTRRLPPRTQPFALAALTSAALLMSCSWGLWQHWFAAAMILGSGVFALAVPKLQAAPHASTSPREAPRKAVGPPPEAASQIPLAA